MGRLAHVGHRLSLGTGRLLYGLEDALDSASGWGALGRITGVAAGVLFVDSLIMRAPVLMYALPPVWVFAAWRMSDSSATPPLSAPERVGDEWADQSAVPQLRVVAREGFAVIYNDAEDRHTVLPREEVNGP